jgi:hypothetical protein
MIPSKISARNPSSLCNLCQNKTKGQTQLHHLTESETQKISVHSKKEIFAKIEFAIDELRRNLVEDYEAEHKKKLSDLWRYVADFSTQLSHAVNLRSGTMLIESRTERSHFSLWADAFSRKNSDMHARFYFFHAKIHECERRKN